MWHMVPITLTWAVSYFVHTQMFLCNRKCKHFYDMWCPLLHRSQFRLSCMSRTSIGHVRTVHVCIWRWKRCAPTAIWHMICITPTWAFPSFVHAHTSWIHVLHYYNVPSCLLAISFFVHEQMFFKRKCNHRSRIIYLVYGGESSAELLCWAVLCCSSYCLCMLPPRSPKTFFVDRKCSRIFQTNNKICTWSKKRQSALFWEKPYIALVVMANIKPYRVYVVWVIIWAKNTLYYIIPTRRKTERKHWVQQYVRDRCLVSFIWPDRNSYA